MTVKNRTSVRELLLKATALLKDADVASPRLDSEILLMHAWEVEKTTLITQANEQLPTDIEERFWALHARRQKREPVAYIIHEKEFWSHPFYVDSRVLIPRPETEHLIEELLQQFPDRDQPLRFCDIGTGSGCIACTLACEYPHAEVTATDISEEALEVARINAGRLGIADRMTFLCGDMFEALEDDIPVFDAILSNPPYVSSTEMTALEPELSFEPYAALTDGEDGLKHLKTLFEDSFQWLKPKGLLIVETGVCGLPAHPPHLRQLHPYSDLAGIERGGVYRMEQSEA